MLPPGVSALPKNEKEFFDTLKAAAMPSLVTWLMHLRNILGSYNNGFIRWVDGYVSPDATKIITSQHEMHPISPTLDTASEFSVSLKDRTEYVRSANPVTQLAHVIRAVDDNEDDIAVRLLKAAARP